MVTIDVSRMTADFFLQFIPALAILGPLTVLLYFGLKRSGRTGSWYWLVAIPPALFIILVVTVLGAER